MSITNEEISAITRSILVSILQHENFEMKNELCSADVKGWDSLTHMIIITEIEEKFSIKFKLRELNKLRNVGSLLELIQSKINERLT